MAKQIINFRADRETRQYISELQISRGLKTKTQAWLAVVTEHKKIKGLE